MKVYLLFILFAGCQNLPSDVNQNDNSESNTSSKDNKKLISDLQKNDTVGFFSNCKYLLDHSQLGALQGVNSTKDSLSYLYFADCYDCKETFEIVFAHKNRRLGYDFVRSEFNKGCSNYFSAFECFAFVAPMHDPDKQSNVHAINMDFPVKVRVFERKSNDNWEFIKSQTVNSFEEYSSLRFNCIYKR